MDLKLIDSADPLPKVRDGTADLALVVRPRDRGTYDGARLVHPRDDAYRAVLPRGHRLAGKQAPIESLLPGATGHRR